MNYKLNIFTINETLSKVKGVVRFTKYFSIGYSLTPQVFVDKVSYLTFFWPYVSCKELTLLALYLLKKNSSLLSNTKRT